ncbi:uncharacterized protein PRCAT00003849001 [Priceomyces carsonii]|uniref:uncharacterized protein n=1 Tax=Priceomyces carsonii TaxID=28549 RepID=UPI002ED8B06D|nr:unnamed protein product [Priceomyces carsonii]
MFHWISNRSVQILTLTLSAILFDLVSANFNSSFTPEHLRHLRNQTRGLFKHAWISYINFGFPADEVRPITCEPYGHDFKNIFNTVQNDAMGNVSLTVLDNLDSLIIMEEWDELKKMLSYLKEEKDTLFEKDTIVQVFESTIRSLGGLLSAHLLLTDVTNSEMKMEKWAPLKEISDAYDGFLLKMAYGLGKKLIVAFKTPSSIPYPRINLAKGLKDIPITLQIDNCLSGATTPVLEFKLLSKLTGDPEFEYFTQQTFWKLWSSRLMLNLIPMTIDPISNKFKDAITGIGASVDSFYEYAVKSSIVFNDEYMWSVFTESYKALLTHLAQGGSSSDGYMLFPNVGVTDGSLFSSWIDLLGAFFPGLQVLAGQLSDAIKTHLLYLKIWDFFDLIPERWTYMQSSISPENGLDDIIPLEWYPLRPEFIESTYYLYRATRDPMYLLIGERILDLFETRFKTTCGFQGIQDVRTGEIQNRMETFVMSETLKYLYLLFDTKDEIFLHSDLMSNKNWVFSTEAHPLWFNKHLDPAVYLKGQGEKPFLKSFLSSISKHYNSSLDINSSAVYRNISSPQSFHFDIPGLESYPHINVADPFESRFDRCEVNPLQQYKKSFLMSGFYVLDNLFHADIAFEKSFMRPSYLPQEILDGSYIELRKSFFDKFSMFLPLTEELSFQCPRFATTEQFELIMGDLGAINDIEISQIKLNSLAISSSLESPLLENDLWIPELVALRLKLERLQPGLVDAKNSLITHDYIRSLRPDDYEAINFTGTSSIAGNTTKDVNMALRLNKVNGIFVNYGLIVWTLPFVAPKPEDGSEALLGVNSDGRVSFRGNVIENLMVWYG